MANPENLDKGARELAAALDSNNAAAVHERLRSDLYQLKPDEFAQFVKKVSEYDKKWTGMDLQLTDDNNKVILSTNSSFLKIPTWSNEVFTTNMGGYWADPGFRSGNQRFVTVGAGFRDSAEERDRKRNKGKFIEQQP